jgi:hypothetical protein
MVRVLVIIAAVALAMTAICFVGVGLVGGFAWEGPWSWHPRHHWGEGWRHDGWSQAAGPVISRDYPWTGGDSLRIDAPADVEYTQGPAAKISVTGPKDMLDRLTVAGGRIDLDGWDGDGSNLKVVMTAPGVTHFEAAGSQTLSIANYKQDELDVDVSGSGDLIAKGQTQRANLQISGSGDADLGGLAADAVKVGISGSGGASIAPKTTADIDISGSGHVTLLTHPAKVSTDISGSGTVNQASAK